MNRASLFVFIVVGLAFLAPQVFHSPMGQAAAQTGTILEEMESFRTQHSKTYLDHLNPGVFHMVSSVAPLHYESVPGSGVFDRENDFRPIRTVNPDFNGWTVQESGWWYRLGNLTAHGSDGWVGFGGRSGQHFLDSRLAVLGYVHYPTRAVEILSDTPDYNRFRLSQIPLTVPMGNGQIHMGLKATWADIFTTPGGGNLSLEWVVGPDGLKENVIINEEAVAWIRANRPPSTPPAETFFGILFHLDLSAIPFLVKENQTVNPNSDFDDSDGKPLELRDARGRFLGLLPIEEVQSRDPAGETLGTTDLRKRIWKPMGSDTHRLLIGARLPDLNSLPAGDLVFDPTILAQVEVGTDDCDTVEQMFSCNLTDPPAPGIVGGIIGEASFRFNNITIPQGSIITSATFEPRTAVSLNDGVGTKTTIRLEDTDNATAPTSLSDFNSRIRTTAFTDWNDQNFTAQFTQSPDISGTVQEVINRPGWLVNNSLQIFWDDNGSAPSPKTYRFETFDESASFGARLNINFTSPPPPPINGGPLFPSVEGDFNAFLLQIILVVVLLVPLLLWLGRKVRNGAPEILAGLALVLFSFRVGQFLADFALALLFIGTGLLIAVYGVFLLRRP